MMFCYENSLGLATKVTHFARPRIFHNYSFPLVARRSPFRHFNRSVWLRHPCYCVPNTLGYFVCKGLLPKVRGLQLTLAPQFQYEYLVFGNYLLNVCKGSRWSVMWAPSLSSTLVPISLSSPFRVFGTHLGESRHLILFKYFSNVGLGSTYL